MLKPLYRNRVRIILALRETRSPPCWRSLFPRKGETIWYIICFGKALNTDKFCFMHLTVNLTVSLLYFFLTHERHCSYDLPKNSNKKGLKVWKSMPVFLKLRWWNWWIQFLLLMNQLPHVWFSVQTQLLPLRTSSHYSVESASSVDSVMNTNLWGV